MYIEKVIIEGFTSYRSKTVLRFQPGLNIIVGQNGAGKTNLFNAIQFVLADEHLTKKERQKILHTTTGIRTPCASVEIVFNNELQRMAEEGKEVKLKREITLKSDAYFLNGKTVTKEQVLHTLQSAGLSKMNPYYIIKQGKVNDLATASDEKRLSLLCEIAGSSVWQELRSQDISLLEDTKKYIAELEKLAEETERDLKNLEEENQVFSEWMGLSKKKHVLQFLLYTKEHTKVTERLAQLKVLLANEQEEEKRASAELKRKEEAKEDTKKRVESFHDQLKTAQNKSRNLADLLTELASEHSQLELEIADEREKSLVDDEQALRNEFNLLEQEILHVRQELSSLSEELTSTTDKEFQINRELMLKEQQRQQLFAETGRQTIFVSLEDRNHWISTEIDKLNVVITKQESQLEALRDDIQKGRAQQNEIIQKIDHLENERKVAFESIVVLKRHKLSLEMEQKNLQISRNDMWRREVEIREQWQQAHENEERALIALKKVIAPSVLQGLDSITITLQEMREEAVETAAYQAACAYRGLLIDQFTCDEEVYGAIDATAGKRLLYHVFDTDIAATEVLRQINLKRRPGAFDFYAYNRLLPKNLSVPDDPDVMPMIKIVNSVKPGMHIVVDQVFGEVLLCNNYDTAVWKARSLNVDCVTVEGDMARRSGVLRGGHSSSERSLMRLYLNFVHARDLKQTEQFNLQDVEEEIRLANTKCDEIVNELQRVVSKIDRTNLSLMEENLQRQCNALSVATQVLESNLSLERKLTLSLEVNRAKVNTLKQELLQDFTTEVEVGERGEVDRLTSEIRNHQKNFEDISQQRLEIESRKNALESKLNEYLLKKKRELQKAIDKRSASLNATNKNEWKQHLKDMEDHLHLLYTKLNKTKEEIETVGIEIFKLSKTVEMATKELEVCKSERHKQQAVYEKQQLVVNEVMESVQRNETLQLSIMTKIASFDPFTEDSEKTMLDKFTAYSEEKLEKELVSVSDILNKFQDVNQNAKIDYTFKREKMTELNENLKTFKRNHEQCRELIGSVDDQRNSALEYSLKQIATSFRTIMGTILTPPAKGYLSWCYDNRNLDEECEEFDEEESEVPDVSRLKGISVNVSFTGSPAQSQMSNLSGGQRSIVSLALIFSILMMDRAPFYILDEADMALDALYRPKIAALVSKFAKRSQFIATTFRSEMLDYADNIIGVKHDAKTQTSRAYLISKDDANDFMSGQGSQSTSSNSSNAFTCSRGSQSSSSHSSNISTNSQSPSAPASS